MLSSILIFAKSALFAPYFFSQAKIQMMNFLNYSITTINRFFALEAQETLFLYNLMISFICRINKLL